jgi:hypothetical protein
MTAHAASGLPRRSAQAFCIGFRPFFDGHPYLRFGARNLSTQGWKDAAFFWMKDMKGT